MTNEQLAAWLVEQLRFVAGPGAAVVVGMVISNFVEKTAWWSSLATGAKRLYAFLAAEALALLAVVGVLVFPTLTAQVQEIIGLVVFTLITTGSAVLGMEFWHTTVNQPRKAATRAQTQEQPPLFR